MGKLLVGHYGEAPGAESISISLRDCHQRLGLKPSDFVSDDEPMFFRKSHRTMGKYLVFYMETAETRDAAVWKAGYYLLPLEAADVLRAFSKQDIVKAGTSTLRPVEVECKDPIPPDVMERIKRWSEQSQPLLFECHCPQLILKIESPSFIRRHWRARLTCKKRCLPALKTHL